MSWLCAGQGMQLGGSPVGLPALAVWYKAEAWSWRAHALALFFPHCEHLRLCLTVSPLRSVPKWQDISSLVPVNYPHESGTLRSMEMLSGVQRDYCKLLLQSAGGEAPPSLFLGDVAGARNSGAWEKYLSSRRAGARTREPDCAWIPATFPSCVASGAAPISTCKMRPGCTSGMGCCKDTGGVRIVLSG